MKNTILFSLCIFFSISSFGQDKDFLAIQKNWNKLLRTDSEIEKDHYHKSLMGLLGNYVRNNGKEDFSQLENFKDLHSPDSNLRIITYFFQKNKDEFVLGGELMAWNPKYDGKSKDSEKWLAFYSSTLIQKNSKITRDTTYSSSDWPAAWYYKVIQKEDKYGQTYYTLIGWIPKNRISQQKIVDVFYLKNDKLHFGAPIFEREGKREYRLLYEYGAQNTMRLSYQEDKDQIIMDHLSPPGAEYHGIYEYYGPDFSYDAFRWEEGRWVYYPDIDIDEGLSKKKSDFDKKDVILEETPVYTPKE